MHPLNLPSQGMPTPALALGGAGLIPFASTAAVLLVGPASWHGFAQAALIAYAAVILSFLGAVHWGLALRDDTNTHDSDTELWRRLGWGVVPALLAWIALLIPSKPGLVLLMLGFGTQYWSDSRASRNGHIPLWYRNLRRWLTLGVVICLGLGLMTT